MINWLIAHSPLWYLTQSLWRDEVFSILVAEKPLWETLPKLSFEPPFYYTLLHYWIRLFGNGEISTRMLSFLGVMGATIILIYWGEQIFKKHFLSWFLPVFFLINPMIIYYAFEVRTYGWYIFFTVLSMYGFFNAKWKIFIIASILGFYTHAYFLVLLMAQTVYVGISEWLPRKKRIASILSLPSFRSMAAIGVLIVPWIIRILFELPRLKQSWYFPVDMHLFLSVLGNMFLGYEGTPWNLWGFTQILSALFLCITFVAIKSRYQSRLTNQMVSVVFLPLFFILGISTIKPLFVNRYLIPVTIAEIFVIVLAIGSIKSKYIQYICAFSALTGTLVFNMWYPAKHAKLPIRDTLHQIHELKNPQDLVYASSSLILFESIYYSPDRSQVFFYNPSRVPFPWYVGDAAFSRSMETHTLPMYPIKAFIVHEDGSFSIQSTSRL